MSIWLDANDRAQHACAIDQITLAIVRISVRIAERDQLFTVAVGVDTIDFVLFLVAHVKEARGIPNGTFGESKTRCNPLKRRIFANQAPKTRRFGVKSVLTRGMIGLPERRKGGGSERDENRNT